MIERQWRERVPGQEELVALCIVDNPWRANDQRGQDLRNS
jgi:hypothetical protein